jgi:CheY-like chemotaxis protein
MKHSQNSPPRSAGQSSTGVTILVVEDDPIILKSLSSVLASSGYEVITASSGPEAVNSILKQRPDLVLLDMFFSENVFHYGVLLDGLLVLAWLRSMDKAGDIPVIVISGDDSAKYKEYCLATGASAFFSKPLDMKKLIRAIEDALESSAEKKLAAC